MKALLAEPLDGSAGLMDRKVVTRAIARVRHVLQQEVPPGHLIPPADPAALLLELCRELSLTPLETVEAVGSEIALQALWKELVPVDKPIPLFERWWQLREGAELRSTFGQWEKS